MKIRSDFVTNSSSSSFLLAFNNESQINDVMNALPQYWDENILKEIIGDIKNGIVSKEKAIDEFKDNISTWNLRFKGKELWDYDWKDRENPNTEVGKFVADYKEEQAAKCKELLKEYNVFSVVGYEDCSEVGSELEHRIMPNLKCTLYRFSHH